MKARSAVIGQSALGLACLIPLLWPLAMAAAQETGQPAADGGAAAPSADDLRAKAQNPVASMISLPLENNLDFGAGDGTAYVLNVQPVIPFRVGDWNLITRTIVPIASVSGKVTGIPGLPEGADGGRVWGLGDINHTTFVSPADPGKVIWGVGPSINLRTATDDQLGSGKWSAGPSAVLITQPPPWSLALLVRQLWSFAGDSDRDDVSQFVVQPFINYNLDDGWYLTTGPAFVANWKASSSDTWTIPVGGGFGRLFTIGEQPVNFSTQSFYNVVRPNNAPDWTLRVSLAFLFPK